MREGLAYFDPESDGIEREPYDPKQGLRVLSRWFNVDNFLAARGLNVDHQSRTRLVEHVTIALIQGAETLKRRADGDYGPDEVANRFPTWEPTKRAPVNRASGPRATDLLEGWAKEAKPAQSTLDLWLTYVETFVRFMGREGALSFQRSDIVKRKLHLVELGNSPKTINDGKLAALKAIFRWGVDNELLHANPASGVSIRRGKKAGERMLGFHQPSLPMGAPALRSVRCTCLGGVSAPGEDIRTEDGIPFMHFTKQAGTLKNPTSERKVPLHPHVVEAGFLEFVRRRGRGTLFYDPKRRRPEAKKSAAEDRGQECRSLGAHSASTWADASGRTQTTPGAISSARWPEMLCYGETLLKAAARAISRIALPGISRSKGPDQAAA